MHTLQAIASNTMVAAVLDGFISIMDKKLHGRVFKRLDGSFDEVVETGGDVRLIDIRQADELPIAPGIRNAISHLCFRDIFRYSALFSQLSVHGQDHGRKTSGSADEIGDRLGKEDAGRAESADIRQDERERHDHDDLAEEREENCFFLAVERLENVLAAVLKSLENEGKEVGVERRHSQRVDGAVGAENADEETGEEDDEDPHDKRVEECPGGHDADGRPDAVVFFCAVVEAQNGRGAVRDGSDGRVEDLPNGRDHGVNGDVDVPAELCQHGIAGDGHKAVGELHDEAGRAETYDILHGLHFRPAGGQRLKTQLGPGIPQEADDEQGGQTL